MERPVSTAGLRHVALYCLDFEACEVFYTKLMGMEVEWRPDSDNVYLTSGNDNLALHKVPVGFKTDGDQRLDHIGFILDDPDHVDSWYQFLLDNGVRMKAAPRQHRDGAKSFYCFDPDGNTVQLIYHPPISKA